MNDNGNIGFLSRSQRVVFTNTSSDAAGPGAFNDTQFKAAKENFAPFGCTSKRETIVPAHGTPAPTAYASDDILMKAGNISHNKVGAGVLHSKSKRFVPAKAPIGPGPGTYALKPALDIVKPKSIHKARSEPHIVHEILQQSPSAPSIPTKFQAFGYEEDDEGRLRPQGAVGAGFTGQRWDSVGPGDYDPRPMERPKVVTNFSKGTERVVGQRPSSNPGPGYYNFKSSFESLEDQLEDDGNFYMKMAQAHKKQLSSFVSTTNRVPIEGKVDPLEPGPQSYNVPRTGVEIKKKDVRIQCFDSTVTRFVDPTPKSQRIKTHPGSYTPLTSDFDKNRLKILRRKRMAARSGWAQNVSFQCSEERFFRPEPETLGPPPTAYQPYTGVGEAKIRENHRSGPFGSTLKRFTYTGDHPPTYRTQEQEEAFRVYADEPKERKSAEPRRYPPVKPSRVFVSNQQRFEANKDIQFTPAPGTYEIRESWTGAGKGVVPMKEKQSRSVIPLEVKRPGPGDYQVGTSLDYNDDKLRGVNRRAAMGGTEKRFISEPVSAAPPPGTYNPKMNLIKPTHNVYLNPVR